MGILAECPICQRKQTNKNKLCVSCGNDMAKFKRSRKVRYWIDFRLPGGKQRREPIGYSITKARDAHGKRRSQKRENRVFDMLPESKMSFTELSEWYLGLKSVKKLAAYDRYKGALNNFNTDLPDQPNVGLWHVPQLIQLEPDRRGSKNNILPSLTLFGVIRLLFGCGMAAGRK